MEKELKPLLDVSSFHDFSIYNLPFGIFSTNHTLPRMGVAFGNWILDLDALQKAGMAASQFKKDFFLQSCLNPLIDLGKPVTRNLRHELKTLLCDEKGMLALAKNKEQYLIESENCTLHLPIQVGDYTDFYSSIEHATNVGMMFRDPANALLPNWRHLPVGYHGRSSSIVVSGTPIRRPKGQIKPEENAGPVFSATRQLDFELETAFVTSRGNELGTSISTSKAEDYIWGMMLFNDWSARDIQKWEYVPLGPFLAKNFASAVSPWVVFLDALKPFSVKGPEQNPQVLPYLQFEGEKNIDIQLEVSLKMQDNTEQVVSKSNFKYMYWNMHQQLAHQTVNGCNVRTGDLYGSGTISGPEPGSYGSMLELTWGGKKPLAFKNGTERKFIEDFDTVILKGWCQNETFRVGFGECRNQILPAYT